MFSGESVFGKAVECNMTEIFQPGVMVLVKATLKAEGKEKTFLMCDYASAQNSNVSDTAHYFTVFI